MEWVKASKRLPRLSDKVYCMKLGGYPAIGKIRKDALGEKVVHIDRYGNVPPDKLNKVLWLDERNH